MNLTTPNQTEIISNLAEMIAPLLHVSPPSHTHSPLNRTLERAWFHTDSPLNRTLDRPWLYQPYSPVGRCLAVIWSLLCASVAILGNSCVLVITSAQYNTLVIDKISIILIRNIAIADFVCGVFITLNIGYLITGRNIYGAVPCYLFTRLFYFFLGVGTIFISLLNLNKLHCLHYPLRVTARTFRQGYLICAGVWVTIAITWAGPLVNRLVHVTTVIVFQVGGSQCSSDTAASSGLVKVMTMTAAVLFALLPVLVILVTSVWLCCFVKRVTGAVQRQSILTLLFVSSAMFSSYIPYFCFVILRDTLPPEQTRSAWFSTFFKITILVLYVIYAANPIIYCLTIRSFATFVKMKITSCRRFSPFRLLPRFRTWLGLALFRLSRVVSWDQSESDGNRLPN